MICMDCGSPVDRTTASCSTCGVAWNVRCVYMSHLTRYTEHAESIDDAVSMLAAGANNGDLAPEAILVGSNRRIEGEDLWTLINAKRAEWDAGS